jgi:hypothetical protein
MEGIKLGNLQLLAEEKDGRVVITWHGFSVEREPYRAINPYFNKIIKDLKDRVLEVRFEELKYFNSSSVVSIIYLITNARDKNIKLKISYDSTIFWQRASFKAMEAISQNYCNIEVVGKTA